MYKHRQFVIKRDDVIENFKKRNPYFPECKIFEYKLITSARTDIPYQSISSRKQIKTIVKYAKSHGTMEAYQRLFELLSKHIRVKDYISFLTKVLNKNQNDKQMYYLLSKFAKRRIKKLTREEFCNIDYNPKTLRDCNREIRHSELAYYKIMKFVIEKNPDLVIENYLDIGCGECIKTKLIGNMIGLPDEKIYGADIEQWSAYSLEQRKKIPINIVTLKENKSLPFKDEQFSFISAFMVLHHVRNLDLMMKELNRITKMGGFIIIREHDCMTNLDAMLIDIEHAIWDVVYDHNYQFFKTYYAQYYDYLEWDLIFEKYGFVFKGGGYDANSIYTVTPTRYFSAIYQKIKEYPDIDGMPLKK